MEGKKRGIVLRAGGRCSCRLPKGIAQKKKKKKKEGRGGGGRDSVGRKGGRGGKERQKGRQRCGPEKC